MVSCINYFYDRTCNQSKVVLILVQRAVALRVQTPQEVLHRVLVITVAVLDQVLCHPVKQDRHPSRLVLQEARHQELIHQVFHLQHEVNNNSNYCLRVLMVRSRIAVVNVLQQALMGLLKDTLKILAKVSQPVPKMESPVYMIQQRPVQKEEMRLQQDF